MTEIRNLPIEQAQRELDEQLAPRNEMTGDDLFAGKEEEARAEIARLEQLDQTGQPGR